MPRVARIDAPGVLHHLMIRGIEHRKIFLNNKDREDFCEPLSNLLLETKTACYAWVLIHTHAHFLLRTGLLPLTTVMRRILTGYVVGFNRRHNRHGQLFQNMMSDERILGDSEFIDSVLSQANERYEPRYERKPQGYDFDRIANRIAEIYGMKRQDVFSKGQLGMSALGVALAAERGEAIAHRDGYKLME
jgi:hypothetical protein